MTALYPVRGLQHTTPEFRRRLREVAVYLGVDPTDLAAILAFESGFNPQARNPKTNASGILQWLPSTAISLYRLTVEQIRAMSAVEQLDLVRRYFEGVKGRGLSLHDLYMLVWHGSPATMGDILARRGESAYGDNSNLDTDGDGVITGAEASSYVRAIAAAARRLPALEDDDPKAPAPTAPLCSSAPPSLRTCRVFVGDSPRMMATRLAGKRRRWRELYATNPRVIVDGFAVGARVTLPEGWAHA